MGGGRQLLRPPPIGPGVLAVNRFVVPRRLKLLGFWACADFALCSPSENFPRHGRAEIFISPIPFARCSRGSSNGAQLRGPVPGRMARGLRSDDFTVGFPRPRKASLPRPLPRRALPGIRVPTQASGRPGRGRRPARPAGARRLQRHLGRAVPLRRCVGRPRQCEHPSALAAGPGAVPTPGGNRRRPAAAQPVVCAQLRRGRGASRRLSRDEPRDPRAGGTGAIRPGAAHAPTARAQRPIHRRRHAPGFCHRRRLDAAPDPNRLGHLCFPAGRGVDGLVLPPRALRLRPPRRLASPGALGLGCDQRRAARGGLQGGHHDRAGDRPALRPDLRHR